MAPEESFLGSLREAELAESAGSSLSSFGKKKPGPPAPRSNAARPGDLDYHAPEPKPDGAKDGDFEKKHPRGKTGTTEGGKFVRKGQSGQEVKRVQRRLGVQVDGAFGGATAAAVRSFQRRHGLQVDGVVGRQTLTALRGHVEKARKLTPGRIDAGDRIFKTRERGRRRRTRRSGGGILVEDAPFDERLHPRSLLGRFRPKGGPADAGATLAAVIPEYDASKLKFGRFAGGTNGARWARHEDGSRWLVKTYQGNEDRVATELLSNAVYREMGARVPRAGRIRLHNGRTALAYEALEGKPIPHVFSRYGPSEEIGKHFMTDALLANWDVAGLEDDNILWGPDGEPFRVDQGGTLEFRAMGDRKDFGPIPLEVMTLIRGQGGRAARTSLPGMKAQARALYETLTPERIDALVAAAPFRDGAMAARVRRNLRARLEWMRLFAEGRAPWPRPASPLREALEESFLGLLLLEVYIPYKWVEELHPRDAHGQWRNKVTGLKLGQGLELGKVQVKRDKDNVFRVVRSGAITKFRNPGDAARAALDKSVKGTEPGSIGGTESFKDWNDYLAQAGVPPGSPMAFNGETALGVPQLQAYLDQANQNIAAAEASSDQYEKKGISLLKARQKEVIEKILKQGGAPNMDALNPAEPDIADAIKSASSSLTTQQAVKNVLEDHPPGTHVRLKGSWVDETTTYVVKGPDAATGMKVILQRADGDAGDTISVSPSTFIGVHVVKGVDKEMGHPVVQSAAGFKVGDRAETPAGNAVEIVGVTAGGTSVQVKFEDGSSDVRDDDTLTKVGVGGIEHVPAPLDKNGVKINVGDVIKLPSGTQYKVEHINLKGQPVIKIAEKLTPVGFPSQVTKISGEISTDEMNLLKATPEVKAVLAKYPPGTIVKWGGQPMEIHGASSDGTKVRTKIPGTEKPETDVGGVDPVMFSKDNFKVVQKKGGAPGGGLVKKISGKQENKLGPGGIPASINDLDLQPGDKVQFKKGGWTYTYKAEMLSGQKKFEAANGTTKYWSGYSKPQYVTKADKSPLAIKPIGGSAGGLSKAEQNLPAMSLTQIKQSLQKPGVQTANMGDLPPGTVIKTPDGKIGVLKPGEPAYEGYVTAYDIESGQKFEPPAGKQPVAFSTSADVMTAAQKTLDVKMKPEAAGTAPTPAHKAPEPDADWDKFPTGNPAEAKLVSHQQAVLSEMSSGEKSAIGYYTGSGYQGINSQLRSSGELGDASTEQKIAEIDAVFEKIDGLPEDMVLWRGVSGNAGEKYKNAQPGNILRDNGYQSTSVRESMADGWGTVILKIKLPKGTKGLYVGPGMGLSSHSSEKELLLRRGIGYRVLSVRQHQGGSKKMIVVEPMTGHL